MNRKRRAAAAAALALFLLLTGCFGRRERTGLLRRWDCGTPVSARFYVKGGVVQELPAGMLSELVTELDTMKFKTHGFHTDYYWHGQFGIELTLDDGTFWNYDGTCAELRSVSITESTDNEYKIRKEFIEITDADFWDTMEQFFPEIANTGILGSW